MSDNLIFPDYEKKWIVNFIQEVFGFLNYQPAYKYPKYKNDYLTKRLKSTKKVFLIIIDWLWDDFLEMNSTILSKYKSDRLVSTFPSTTSVANSSFYCWYPWKQTWIPSWYFFHKELWTIISPIKYTTKLWKKLDELWIEPSDLFSIIEPSRSESDYMLYRILPKIFKWSKFNQQFWGKNLRYDPGVDWFINKVKESIEQNWKWFFHAYLPDLDTFWHDYWINSAQSIDLFKKIESWLGNLIKNKNDDTLFLITADHWMIDSWSNLINIHDDEVFRELINFQPWWENRYLYVSVDSKKHELFEEHIRINYSKKLHIFKNEWETLSLFWKWEPVKWFLDRIWDYTLVAKDKYSFDFDKFNIPKKKKIWMHWWLSSYEMHVPLLIA